MADVAPPPCAQPCTRSKPSPQPTAPSNPDVGPLPTVAYNPDARRQPDPTTPSARHPDVSPRHQTSIFPHCYVNDGNRAADHQNHYEIERIVCSSPSSRKTKISYPAPSRPEFVLAGGLRRSEAGKEAMSCCDRSTPGSTRANASAVV
uniref:Uncharacterized protein n=1 Tax=Oryza meridionalis TaxID=40149 RepID=A0A0E0CDR0_9ORYZ